MDKETEYDLKIKEYKAKIKYWVKLRAYADIKVRQVYLQMDRYKQRQGLLEVKNETNNANF